MIWLYLVLISGAYSALITMLVKANNNLGSFLIYKAIPFLLSLACILYAVKELNWV